VIRIDAVAGETVRRVSEFSEDQDETCQQYAAVRSLLPSNFWCGSIPVGRRTTKCVFSGLWRWVSRCRFLVKQLHKKGMLLSRLFSICSLIVSARSQFETIPYAPYSQAFFMQIETRRLILRSPGYF